MEISIEDTGIDAIARGVRNLTERAYMLGPVGYQIRRRILESERRHLTATRFSPRKSSTIRRYRYRLRGMDGTALTPGRGPLNRTGRLRHTLTTEHAPGQRDSIQQRAKGLNVLFGVKARGPAAYVGMQSQGSGDRRARDPFRFDAEAHAAATGDVIDYMLERWGNRA